MLSTAGQSCVAGSLLLVQRWAYDEVVSRLADLASRITLGRPLEESTQVGPLQNARQLEQVSQLVGAAIDASATAAHTAAPRSTSTAASSTCRPCWRTWPTPTRSRRPKSLARWWPRSRSKMRSTQSR